MRISVVVTTYNRPDALKKVLEGLIHQSRKPDEILVADDGSENETRDCLTPYLSRDDIKIHHVWQKDEGFRLSRIRNKAILKSSGEYLVTLDGDCIPEYHFIEDHEDLAQEGCFFQGKRVLVNASAQKEFHHGDIRSFPTLIWYGITGKISNSHHIVRMGAFPSYLTTKLSGVRGCNMGFFKRDLLGVNGYNQEIQGWGREDTEIVVRLYRYGLKRKENPFRAICYHLWHPENSRDDLATNDGLLASTSQSDSFYCLNGMDQNISHEMTNQGKSNQEKTFKGWE